MTKKTSGERIPFKFGPQRNIIAKLVLVLVKFIEGLAKVNYFSKFILGSFPISFFCQTQEHEMFIHKAAGDQPAQKLYLFVLFGGSPPEQKTYITPR